LPNTFKTFSFPQASSLFYEHLKTTQQTPFEDLIDQANFYLYFHSHKIDYQSTSKRLIDDYSFTSKVSHITIFEDSKKVSGMENSTSLSYLKDLFLLKMLPRQQQLIRKKFLIKVQSSKPTRVFDNHLKLLIAMI